MTVAKKLKQLFEYKVFVEKIDGLSKLQNSTLDF